MGEIQQNIIVLKELGENRFQEILEMYDTMG